MKYRLPEWDRMPVPAAERIRRLPVPFFSDLYERVRHARAKFGDDLINLGQGNPDLTTPRPIVDALRQAADNPLYHKYSPFTGFSFLKEAAAKRYREDFGVDLDPEKEVAVLFGSRAGIVEIAQCFLNSGDVCLVPDPGYPDYWSGIHLTGARMVTMPLRESNDFLPDYAEIPESERDMAKLMFLNYPNNPTGAVAPTSFLEETVELAQRHNILIASDFAYGAFGFDGRRPTSLLSVPGAKDTAIEFYTLSKTYNMAGWRVAFAVGNEAVVRMIDFIQDHYFCSLFGAVQAAAAEALSGPQDEVRRLCDIYEKRRNVLFEELEAAGWHARPPRGTFYAWLPVPPGYTSASLADYVLKKAGVLLVPGSGFGAHGEGYVRVGLNTSESSLREAVRRIAKLDLF